MAQKISEMIIVLNSDGGIFVTGPLDNKPLCKALLAGASEIVETGASTNLVEPDKHPSGRYKSN